MSEMAAAAVGVFLLAITAAVFYWLCCKPNPKPKPNPNPTSTSIQPAEAPRVWFTFSTAFIDTAHMFLSKL
jgi:hypothetical protein